MVITIARSRVTIVLGIILYVAAFNWAYIHEVSPMFGYSGLTYTPPPAFVQAILWLAAVVPAFWIPIVLSRPSQLSYWALYLTVYVPSIFVPAYATLGPFESIKLAIGLLACGLGLLSVYRIPLLRIPRIQVSPQFFWGGIGIFSLVTYVWSYRTYGAIIQFVSLADTYSQRALAKDAGGAGLMGYFTAAQTFAVNPFLMAYGIASRRYSILALGIAGQVYFYAVGAMKSMLLSVLIMVVLVIIFRFGERRFAHVAVFGTVALFAVPLIPILWSDPTFKLYYCGVVFTRTYALPGALTGYYIDYFTTHTPTWFSHVKGFSLLVKYPYDLDIPRLIGLTYFGNAEVDANGNLWADGFAGLGYTGMAFTTLFTALSFWLMDSASRSVDRRMAVLTFSFYAVSFTNMSVFSTMLGMGLWLAIAMVHVMPRSLLADVAPEIPKPARRFRLPVLGDSAAGSS